MAAIISVIVCTYNRADRLPDCLASLAEQTLPNADYEIVVVDNNSTDATARVVADFAARWSHVRPIFEGKQGLACARNTGMRHAAAELVAFTDDDAMVPSDWLASILDAFAGLPPETVAVGGEIEPVWEAPRPEWLTDALLHPLSARLDWSTTPRFLGKYEWLCEVNSIYKKSVLLEHGGFPESLGRIGTNLLSGENAVNLLLEEKGYRFYFDPRIVVRHCIARDRVTKSWFRRRIFWQGVTSFFVNKYLRERGVAVTDWGALQIPCSEGAWCELFSDAADTPFPDTLNVLANLGYALASQGLLVGR